MLWPCPTLGQQTPKGQKLYPIPGTWGYKHTKFNLDWCRANQKLVKKAEEEESWTNTIWPPAWWCTVTMATGRASIDRAVSKSSLAAFWTCRLIKKSCLQVLKSYPTMCQRVMELLSINCSNNLHKGTHYDMLWGKVCMTKKGCVCVWEREFVCVCVHQLLNVIIKTDRQHFYMF